MPTDDRSRLLSLLSHELRGPLGVVRGYLRLLQQQATELSGPHRTAVAKALRATDRVADILGQVSTLAQLHQHETPFERRPIGLAALLQASADAVPIPDDPTIQVVVRDTPDLQIIVDEALLCRALTSLASAVVRAQPVETIVWIATRRETIEGTDGVAITIAPDLDVSRPTQHALDVTRSGLGLDLPIAALLVAAHLGRVQELHDNDRYLGVVVWLPISA